MQDKFFSDTEQNFPDTQDRERTSNLTVLNHVQDIDRALLKLIGRRCQYIATLRRHRGQRDAVAETNTERALRLSWEEGAQEVSHDPKLARDMFTLLQEIKPLSSYDHEAKSGKEAFNLAPSPEAVDINLPKIPSLRQAAFRTFLAAAGGRPLSLSGQILSDGLIDFVKALNQAGSRLSWDAHGAISNREGSPLVFTDKIIYIGEDPLHFYLLSALALASPGKIKFTGGSALKLADFSAWRNTLPLFGARLAHLVPKNNGLPVHLECSALFPESVDLPDNTPGNALIALLLAAPFWGVPIKLNGAGNPGWQAALEEALPVLKASGVLYSQAQGIIHFSGETPQCLPETPELAADPLLSALFLSISAVIPGKIQLGGPLERTEPGNRALLELLAWAGVAPQSEGDILRVCRSEQDSPAPSSGLPAAAPVTGLPPEHTPLVLLLSAARARDLRQPVPLPALDFGEGVETVDLPLFALDFLELLGASYIPGALGEPGLVRTTERLKPQAAPWIAPSPVWAMSLAIGAYLRPQIKLANPGMATELLPNFWHIYNGLPKPQWQRRPKEEVSEAPTSKRRRVIAKS